MKNVLSVLVILMCITKMWSQDYSSVFTAGLEDSNRFAKGYLQPGAEAVIHSMNNGWFSSAEAKPLLGFEISFIGNVAMVDDSKRTFAFTADGSTGLSYQDGSITKNVASVLGTVSPDVVMEYTVTDPTTGLSETVEIILPESLISKDVQNIPSGFLQASVGVLKGTELKARILPQIEINDRQFGVFGVGVQHEFTKWLPADRLWPVAISGLVAYSHLTANYDASDVIHVDGTNQRFENKTNTMLYEAIFSTKLPVINFYGGVGYVTGTSKSYLKGSYVVYEGFGVSAVVEDPISVNNKVNGVRATLGTRLKLGFFRLNADYTFADFNSATVGVSFGFR